MNLKTEKCKVGPKSGSTEGYFEELMFPCFHEAHASMSLWASTRSMI